MPTVWFQAGNSLGFISWLPTFPLALWEMQMMTMVEHMRARLREAMKAHDAVKTGFLRYWIAQLILATGAEVSDADAVKKMRGILRRPRPGRRPSPRKRLPCFGSGYHRLLMQRGFRRPWFREGPVAAPKEGMAMGIAMKALAGQQVESDDVKAAVASLRQ